MSDIHGGGGHFAATSALWPAEERAALLPRIFARFFLKRPGVVDWWQPSGLGLTAAGVADSSFAQLLMQAQVELVVPG